MELPNQRARDRVPPRKFSTFIKKMIVELDRDPTLYPDGNIVEVCEEGANQSELFLFAILVAPRTYHLAASRWVHHKTHRRPADKSALYHIPRADTRAVQSGSRPWCVHVDRKVKIY
jgi:hypothetical protein